jgi:hypothetical protein
MQRPSNAFHDNWRRYFIVGTHHTKLPWLLLPTKDDKARNAEILEECLALLFDVALIQSHVDAGECVAILLLGQIVEQR